MKSSSDVMPQRSSTARSSLTIESDMLLLQASGEGLTVGSGGGSKEGSWWALMEGSVGLPVA